MALEKRDPLPVGRYWLDVTNENEGLFEAWVNLHDATIESSSPLESGGVFELGTWYLFHVAVPTPWGLADKLGWPTIADEHVATQADTADAPEVEQPTFGDFFGDLASDGMTLVVLLALGYLLIKDK